MIYQSDFNQNVNPGLAIGGEVMLFTVIEQNKCNFVYKDGNTNTLTSQRPADWESRLMNFEKAAKAAGLTHLWDGPSSPDRWISRKRSAKELKIHRLENDCLQIDVLPGYGGRIWRMKDLASGKEVLRAVADPNGFQIDRGYEEYSAKEYRSPGCFENYQVKEESKQRIVLEAKLGNGLTLTRRIELPAGRRGLEIMSTLTNSAEQTRKACLRIHPEFAVDSPADILLAFKRSDGSLSKRPLLDGGSSSDIVDLTLAGSDRPCGEWGFLDKKRGLGVINRFEKAELSCYLCCSAPDKHINLELWSAEKDLKPGENIEIHQSYDIINAFPEESQGGNKE